MKLLVYLNLIALLPVFCYADAGFNIGRPKAPCYAVFKGIDKLSDYEFIKTSEYVNDKPLDSSNKLSDNDTLKIYYIEGKRYWYGAVKILIRNKITQQSVDSFNLIAEGDNLVINFTGVENNKVKYTVYKTKADYPYELFMGENVNNASVAKRNKYILISLSVIGFLMLAFMFYKRRNNNPSPKPENI
ncbi:MAG TPA: hypothetical protein VIM07_15895 [Chitinophagaceae bacterium]